MLKVQESQAGGTIRPLPLFPLTSPSVSSILRAPLPVPSVWDHATADHSLAYTPPSFPYLPSLHCSLPSLYPVSLLVTPTSTSRIMKADPPMFV
ncbi:hypothetical protein E2C01_012034 [Portunus trituberculatus]|uniref:Uncharacterized protein n=1 Tax=Portunus trituberculatus TaxID=210409 RepID=A0A5B7DDF4_PORTR|nr:hypothetical protein [Portunus trituberculatus]